MKPNGPPLLQPDRVEQQIAVDAEDILEGTQRKIFEESL